MLFPIYNIYNLYTCWFDKLLIIKFKFVSVFLFRATEFIVFFFTFFDKIKKKFNEQFSIKYKRFCVKNENLKMLPLLIIVNFTVKKSNIGSVEPIN